MKQYDVVSDTRYIICVNERLNSMQSIVSTCYRRKALVSEKAGFYWSKVDFTLVAQPKRMGTQIPGNCPIAETACMPKDLMAVSDDGQRWSVAVAPWR